MSSARKRGKAKQPASVLSVLGLGAIALVFMNVGASAETRTRFLSQGNMSPWIQEGGNPRYICPIVWASPDRMTEVDFYPKSQCSGNFSITDATFTLDTACALADAVIDPRLQNNDVWRMPKKMQACNISSRPLNLSDK